MEINNSLIACSMSLWCIKEVDTDFRQFTFKWNQGMIHGNTVIAHFGDVDRKCTFCKLRTEIQMREELGRELTIAEKEGIAAVDEDRPHIFWDCITVNRCIQDVYGSFWGNNVTVNKGDFLMGKELGTEEATVLYMLINMYIKYRIWKYKLAGVLPLARCISNDLNRWVNTLVSYKKWRMMLPLVRQYILA
jgi:hypothetical protein